eukprot:1394135-Amphidinium_carterae.1
MSTSRFQRFLPPSTRHELRSSTYLLIEHFSGLASYAAGTQKGASARARAIRVSLHCALMGVDYSEAVCVCKMMLCVGRTHPSSDEK